MWTKEIASKILRGFAEERRRVISEWRILIAARRLAHAENAPLPDAKKARDILKELQRRGDVISVKGAEGVYIVDVAYAILLDVSEEQIVQEANPWVVFAFLTAMVYHSLTDLFAKEVYAIEFKDGEHIHRTPLGTTPDDWVDLSPPLLRRPKAVRDTKIVWSDIKSEWEFGVTVGYSAGVPVYLTDVERTLLDALRMPDKCGGIAKVLQAWRNAAHCDLDRLIAYTERFDIQNLKQRVGYLLEKLNRQHPHLAQWRDGLQRGGSVKLLASGPYSETYSSEWNLSLNVDSSVLDIIEQE